MKLIKINGYWIVIDLNADINRGDLFLLGGKHVNKYMGTDEKRYKTHLSVRIIASENPEYNLPNIIFSDVVSKELGIVDLNNIAEERFPVMGIDFPTSINRQQGFIIGYNQALEDNKEKKYTLDEVSKLMCWAASMSSGMRDSGKSLSDIAEQIRIKSESLNKQEYKVEIEMEQKELGEVYNGHSSNKMYSDPSPKITNNSITILKIVK